MTADFFSVRVTSERLLTPFLATDTFSVADTFSVDVIEMPAQYAAVVPLVNTVLVAVQQLIADNR